MEINNFTPFSAIPFKQYNPKATLNVTVAIRGTFELQQEGVLTIAPEQAPIQLKDIYQSPTVEQATGAEPDAQLVNPTDLIPYRPGTDVIVISHSYAHGPRKSSWAAGVKVSNTAKVIQVHGPRRWQVVKNRKNNAVGFEMSESDFAEMTPLNYRMAFGGAIPDTSDVDECNPLGCGRINLTFEDNVPAPRIECLDDPITDWQKAYTPQSFFPIAPAWQPRRQYAGTYDKNWIETQHPFLPEDFDYRFYQYAHPDLIFTPYLNGDETIQLARLHQVHEILTFQLPAMRLIGTARWRRGELGIWELPLDGVYIHLLETPAKVFLTWRLGLPWNEGIQDLELYILDKALKHALNQQGVAVKSVDASIWESH